MESPHVADRQGFDRIETVVAASDAHGWDFIECVEIENWIMSGHELMSFASRRVSGWHLQPGGATAGARQRQVAEGMAQLPAVMAGS